MEEGPHSLAPMRVYQRSRCDASVQSTAADDRSGVPYLNSGRLDPKPRDRG